MVLIIMAVASFQTPAAAVGATCTVESEHTHAFTVPNAFRKSCEGMGKGNEPQPDGLACSKQEQRNRYSSRAAVCSSTRQRMYVCLRAACVCTELLLVLNTTAVSLKESGEFNWHAIVLNL